jgi:hypothetical protein
VYVDDLFLKTRVFVIVINNQNFHSLRSFIITKEKAF